MSARRYVCIHGHFYQPPRENPWLECVESQDSAHPYHDWNERITAECYGPNARARILDADGRIVRIVNNYSRISFNFGPTLLSWLQAKAPEVYAGIIEADRLSLKRYSGHGSALAQAHSHAILPLSSARDKRTEILWGIADFESRFQRKPEGMWLAETAADTETLEALAEAGIRFTVLAPNQAAAVRKAGEPGWTPVPGGRVDPRRAYRIPLPSGRDITVFFYNGPISRAVAFEGLLTKGEHLSDRLLSGFGREDWDQLVHIATDGESYGHHHRYGEMALAYALDLISRSKGHELTNYGEFLEKFPPEYEARIVEKSAWSCAHGVGRWSADCGCHTGGQPGWNQAWRAPLRESLDWLRDRIAGHCERLSSGLLKELWSARDAYIDVTLDRNPEKVSGFLAAHSPRELSAEEQVVCLRILEAQRHSLLMFTSCGWFFNDLAGLETVQILRYASRAIQLIGLLGGPDLEPEFMARLAQARSNDPSKGDGRQIFETEVARSRVGMVQVGAHYGISSLFEDFPKEARIHAFDVTSMRASRVDSGRSRMAVGHARIRSRITGASQEVTYGVVHLGDQNLSGGARPFRGTRHSEALTKVLTNRFTEGDIASVLRTLDKEFPDSTFSLRSLFRDEQRRIVGHILEDTLKEAEDQHLRLWEKRSGLMRFLAEIGVPQPPALRAAAELALNVRLRRSIEEEPPDLHKARRHAEELLKTGLKLDTTGVVFALERAMEKWSSTLPDGTDDTETLDRLFLGLQLADELRLGLNLWKVQNAYYSAMHGRLPARREAARSGDATAAEWVERFESLGEKLFVRLAEVPEPPFPFS